MFSDHWLKGLSAGGGGAVGSEGGPREGEEGPGEGAEGVGEGQGGEAGGGGKVGKALSPHWLLQTVAAEVYK